MSITTINNIQNSLELLQENLPSFRQYLKESCKDSLDIGQWGNEREYSPNGVIMGIQNLVIDLTYLVEYPDYFIRLSTYDERQEIHQYLSQIADYIRAKNPSYIISPLDDLKRHLRPYNLRTDKKRMIVFQQKIDELSRSLEQISRLLEEAKKDRERIIEISDNATEKANTIVTKEKEISELLTQSETTKTEIESVRDELKRVASAIQEYYTESSKAKSQTITHREEVQEFVEEIQGHQDAIEKQAEQFKRFEEVLEQNKIEQKQYLDDALKLINESKASS